MERGIEPAQRAGEVGLAGSLDLLLGEGPHWLVRITAVGADARARDLIAGLQRETLVGFAYDGFDELCPVTVESGVIESSYNLKFPDGRVRASWGEEFDSEAEMIEAARKRFVKVA